MECNRDEAVRSKEIAETKFLAKDAKAAKKFALKAQNLYPELEGITQMVMTFEVYISAEEEKMNGESNWYGVLGLTPLADDETIRKQYRKLALLLHPDKNRSIGAEGAFQLVSQAWSLLSDKSKRTAYDLRYGARRNQNATNQGPSPPMQNGFYNFANTAATPQTKVPKGSSNNSNSKRTPSSVPHASRRKERRTFWTVCHRCKMQYEYLRMYLNHNLLCPNCHEAYYAVEIDPPSTKISKPTDNSPQRKHTKHGSDASRNSNNFQWVPFSESTGAKSAAQAANMVQQAYDKVKRERQKAQAAARKEEALRRKNLASKRRMDAETSGHADAAKRRKGVEDCGPNKENNLKQVNCKSGNLEQGNLQKIRRKEDGIRRFGINHFVMEKAREEINNKLKEHKVLEKIEENESANLKDSSETHCSLPDQNKLREKLVDHILSVDVEDPDFHNFDESRTEKCFRDNQVWAVYDDVDGMPRHYAMIRNVISLNPFKVSMSWLSSLTHGRLGHMSWFLTGSSKTCGEFRVDRLETCESIDCFSHNVRSWKSTSKTIQIFPQKGDVWALYKNWSPEWNELTEDEVINKYEMVEVLEDYDEEMGAIVVPLVKVAGFKAVFHQHLDPSEIRRIPKREMSRFSHMVPSHLLTGQEGTNSPKGCHELDPAATPLQFLKIMANIEEIQFVESDDEVEFVNAVDCDVSTNTNTVEVIS
ncbi:hypothetical protein ACP275_11G072200 [Erythranthe tilingii]